MQTKMTNFVLHFIRSCVNHWKHLGISLVGYQLKEESLFYKVDDSTIQMFFSLIKMKI